MLDSTELPDAGFCPDRMKRAARKQLSDGVSHRKVSEMTGLKRRLNDSNFASRCEGWDSGSQVRFANSKFLLNFETKTDLKLFATHDK
jgi:hypothetical protein